MTPLVPLAALGAFALYAMTKKSSASNGIRSALGPPTHVTGRSGTQWDVQFVEAPVKPLAEGGAVVVAVILNDPNVPAQRHMVIEYMQKGDGKPPLRTLVTKGQSAPFFVQAAIADFGVTGPAAEAAAKAK